MDDKAKIKKLRHELEEILSFTREEQSILRRQELASIERVLQETKDEVEE